MASKGSLDQFKNIWGVGAGVGVMGGLACGTAIFAGAIVGGLVGWLVSTIHPAWTYNMVTHYVAYAVIAVLAPYFVGIAVSLFMAMVMSSGVLSGE